MGRVCLGRVCYGPSLSSAEFVIGRVVQLPTCDIIVLFIPPAFMLTGI